MIRPLRLNPSPARFDAVKMLRKLEGPLQVQNTDEDIKNDPGTALHLILSLGVEIGRMDADDNPDTARVRFQAEQLVNRIAGYYEHLLG